MQVYEVLARTVYGKRKHAEVGVARLLNEGAFKAAFPLHDVRDHMICHMISQSDAFNLVYTWNTMFTIFLMTANTQ